MVRSEEFIFAPRTKCGLRKTLGVGINDLDYQVVVNTASKKQIYCPFYIVWRNMLSRCYSKARRKSKPNSPMMTVYEEWFKLSKFKKWMEVQPWEGEGIEFSATILNPEAKEFNPHNCCFIDKRAAMYFAPLYDSSIKGYNRYRDGGYEVRADGGYQGYFKTPWEARTAYLEAKLKFAKKYLAMVTEQRVINALNGHIANVHKEINDLKLKIEAEKIDYQMSI